LYPLVYGAEAIIKFWIAGGAYFAERLDNFRNRRGQLLAFVLYCGKIDFELLVVDLLQLGDQFMAFFVVLQQIPECFIFLLNQKARSEDFVRPVFK
jgi:hypothetical protein